MSDGKRAREAPRAPGILLGVGLGGFVDGILLHQILQWHHLLTDEGSYPRTTVAGLEANTLADGLFHAFTWVCVAVGIWLFWRRSSEWRWALNGRAFAGWLFVGLGAFNLVEGLVDHHILGIHHVRDDLGGPLSWDVGFLLFSLALMLAGWVLSMTLARPRTAAPREAATPEPGREPERPGAKNRRV